MFKTLKLLLIVLSLGAFILPKQMLFAQQTAQCCEQKKQEDNCCKTEKKQPCHDSNSKSHSDKNHCGNDCANCHSCSLFSLFNFVSPETLASESIHLVETKLNFNYSICFISNNFKNIWQPPKIA
ncbi:hypothetical protein ACM44_03620 [Chryseobacterium koreense CCUG 49689]|uniref:Uncharacterized protein n=1 Tax=Chryseobacterium koreense CCUG 49689 TaxID=1304281 RepID=A0A0J7J121_9FLAO|nr:hypothetical protein ACM44_03620 [Chryseobacterium koreense CCUG 49689]MBB5332003.1 hypothetical protein [Chryseobacterium koreense]